MQALANFINSSAINYNIDGSIIRSVQVGMNEEMKMSGWISLILSNRECLLLKVHNGILINEGYLLNDEKVLKVFSNNRISSVSYSEELVENGIVDLEHGSRFEGFVLKDYGVPFGYGQMYDDDGVLLYMGIMINWKRFGYGVSYHNNGFVAYKGYWCDDNRFGFGKLFDRNGTLVKECEWCNGKESEKYEGNGSQEISIGVKQLKLSDGCVSKDWDVSWFYRLESIEIGSGCFDSVQTFMISGLNRLKRLVIGSNSFTSLKNDYGFDDSKSFSIINCEALESINIGNYSFSDFSGNFELRNLASLQSIKIGEVGDDSYNFWCNSFIIQCIDSILMDETIALPALQSITLGAFAFGDAPSVIMEGSRQ